MLKPKHAKHAKHVRRVPADTPTAALSWRQRVLDLRHALGWSTRKFARISGISIARVWAIEGMRGDQHAKPYFPALATIHKIRRMESAFDEELAQYRSNPARYNRLVTQPTIRTRQQYSDKYTYAHTKHLKPKLPPIQRPRRPEDLAALGGMEAFRDPVRKASAGFSEASKAASARRRLPDDVRAAKLAAATTKHREWFEAAHRFTRARRRERLERKMDELLRMFAPRDSRTPAASGGTDADDREEPTGRPVARCRRAGGIDTRIY